MMNAPKRSALSRRAAVTSIAAGGAAALVSHSRAGASAQTNTELAGHPMAGVWLALANPPLPDDPPYYGPAVFAVDGVARLIQPINQVGPGGVQFNTDFVGVWEAYDEFTAHFTVVQMLTDAEGAYVGTITIEGHPRSEDGQTFIDDGSLNTVTIRDASGAVLEVIEDAAADRPVRGWRLTPGNAGFPEGTPEAGTPVT